LIAIQERLFRMIGDFPEKQKVSSYMAVKIMQVIYPFLGKLYEVDE